MQTKTQILAGAAVVASLAAPAVASAKPVTDQRPWKAKHTYLVTADLDGRPQPKLNPVAKVNHLRQGQWVRITCQTTGRPAYGSRVWTKVDGLFVPDRFVKTYTDGFLKDVPRCTENDPDPTPEPPPPAGPTRAELRAAADAVAFERVYGSNYRIFKERYPSAGIIWKNNGCSVPRAIVELRFRNVPAGKAVGYYSNLFEKSCDRHDFGYRNYGSKTDGLKLGPSESQRDRIDARFHTNMDHQCQRTFPRKYLDAVKRGACYKASDVFYKAVSVFASSKFS